MKSEKCSNCGTTVFIDEGDQCPKECASCGHIINPNFVEEEKEVETEVETEEKEEVAKPSNYKGRK